MFVYPLASLLQRAVLFAVPFDTETINRLIIPFAFEGRANLSWVLTESVRLDFTRPIYSLTFLFDFLAWKGNYVLYHLTDFLLSWITIWILLYILWKRIGPWVASLTVVIWSLLPSQAYSMVSFTGRNDRLVVLFLLASIYLYDRAIGHSEKGEGWRRRNLVYCLLVLIAGYFAKESCLPYASIIFAWGWLVLKRGFVNTLKEGRIVWIGAIAASATFYAARMLIGMSMPMELSFFNGAYFSKFVILLNMGLPFHLVASPLTGILAFSAFLLTALIEKIPRPIRFGAALMLLSLIPFPLVWIQHTFLWLPTVGLSMILAYCISTLAGMLRGTSVLRRVASWACIVLPLCLLGLWGRAEARRASDIHIAFKVASRFLVETQTGPIYDGSNIVDTYPVLVPYLSLESGYSRREIRKAREYIEDIIQVMIWNPESRVTWSDSL